MKGRTRERVSGSLDSPIPFLQKLLQRQDEAVLHAAADAPVPNLHPLFNEWLCQALVARFGRISGQSRTIAHQGLLDPEVVTEVVQDDCDLVAMRLRKDVVDELLPQDEANMHLQEAGCGNSAR